MADWLFNKDGRACLILDNDRVRSDRGVVVGWISSSNVYSLNGQHIGWFEGGVIYDSSNAALAFTRSHSGSIPNTPGLAGTPGMPGLAGIPGRPGLTGAPGRPGRVGWSTHEPAGYFDA